MWTILTLKSDEHSLRTVSKVTYLISPATPMKKILQSIYWDILVEGFYLCTPWTLLEVFSKCF